MGLCYLNSFSEKDKALQYLEKPRKMFQPIIMEISMKPLHLYLHIITLVKHIFDYKFDLARENFEKFKYYLTSEDKELLKDAQRQIELTYNAKI